MTYMGTGDPTRRRTDYYPEWLDNLADDVTLEAGALEGTARGAEACARSWVLPGSCMSSRSSTT